MKLEKAIEIGKELAHPGVIIDSPDGVEAIKLGIKALKRLERDRGHRPGHMPNLLPSETRE